MDTEYKALFNKRWDCYGTFMNGALYWCDKPQLFGSGTSIEDIHTLFDEPGKVEQALEDFELITVEIIHV